MKADKQVNTPQATGSHRCFREWLLAILVLGFSLTSPALRADDETDIRAMLADIDAKALAHDLAGLLACYSPDYLHSGQDYSVISADLREHVPRVTFFHFDIEAVNVQGEFATVEGTVTAALDDGDPQTWREPSRDGSGIGQGWLKKENGVWRLHGNQSRVESYEVFTGYGVSARLDSLLAWVDSPLAILSATVSGPCIPLMILIPDPDPGSFSGSATPSQRPEAGSVYTLRVVFVDGASETLTDTIGAWVETAPEVTVSTVADVTTFSWNDVSADVPNARNYRINVFGNGVFWSFSDIPVSQTSIVFNQDGSAAGTLRPRQTYTVEINIQNATHDFAWRSRQFTVNDDEDSDGDGLPDSWEILHFADVTTSDGRDDHDGDGLDDGDEYLCGTNPTAHESAFRVRITWEAGAATVSWDAVPGRLYGVHWCSGVAQDFQILQTGIESPQNSFTDNPRAGQAAGFYQVDVRLKP